MRFSRVVDTLSASPFMFLAQAKAESLALPDVLTERRIRIAMDSTLICASKTPVIFDPDADLVEQEDGPGILHTHKTSKGYQPYAAQESDETKYEEGRSRGTVRRPRQELPMNQTL